MTKIKYGCGDSMYATCINYDTPLPEFSEITECADLNETTTELYSLVGELREQSDLSELGERCLDYVEVSGKIFVKNALLKMEEEICLLKEKVLELETTALCDTSIQDCSLNFGTLTDACSNQPQTLAETLQLILDNLNTP